MSTNKLQLAMAGIIALVPIGTNIHLAQAGFASPPGFGPPEDAKPKINESAAELDLRKAKEVFDPNQRLFRGSTVDEWEILSVIVSDWQKIVDAAGLHTLLNQNKQTYTTLADFSIINNLMDNSSHNSVKRSAAKKLFAPENRADLQRILKCNIIPFELSKATIPNNRSKVVLKTMDSVCTFTVQGLFTDEIVPVMENVSVGVTPVECGLTYGERRCRGGENIYAQRKTGKMTRNVSNTIWINGKQVLIKWNSGEGRYVQYSTGDIKIPPDLQLKYRELKGQW